MSNQLAANIFSKQTIKLRSLSSGSQCSPCCHRLPTTLHPPSPTSCRTHGSHFSTHWIEMLQYPCTCFGHYLIFSIMPWIWTWYSTRHHLTALIYEPMYFCLINKSINQKFKIYDKVNWNWLINTWLDKVDLSAGSFFDAMSSVWFVWMSMSRTSHQLVSNNTTQLGVRILPWAQLGGSWNKTSKLSRGSSSLTELPYYKNTDIKTILKI